MAQDTEINRKTQCNSKSQSSVTCLHRPIIQCRCPGWKIFYTTELWELKQKWFESVYKVLACAVGLVDHRLDDPSPGIDKPDGAKQRTVEMSIKAHLFFINVLASFKGKIIAHSYGYGFEQTQSIKFWCEAHPALFVLQTWMIPQIVQLTDSEMNKFTILPGRS